MGMAGERGDVAAARKTDADRGSGAVSDVVLVELRSQASRFDPDNRVEPGIVGLAALEDLDTNRVLLQLIRFTRQRLVDDVTEKAADAAGGRKTLGGQDAIELGADVRVGDRGHALSMKQRVHGVHGVHRVHRVHESRVTVTATVTDFKSMT